MEELFVRVGIFWAVPNKEEGGWEFRTRQKSYPLSSAKELANPVGFLDYPYSHYDEWEEARHRGDAKDCYFYPRGRILYDVNRGMHRVFADECLVLSDLEELRFIFDIDGMELCRDEHYVSAFTHRRSTERPALKYNILRGREKIGENLIEIEYGKTKLLVELGKALDGGEELSDIEKAVLQEKYDAVIVSHYHADHAGLIEQKRDCPIYLGAGARRILEAMDEYHGKTLPDNILAYRGGKPFYVGTIKITPFCCDHSAFDSYMLLFEAGGKSILYTGDFRFHGRKNSDELFAHLPRRVDVLISEGTNLGSDKPCFSERELEDRAAEWIGTTNRPVFVLQSASNIDRLVSFYRAAKRCGRVFYEDVYTALLAQAAGGRIPRPDIFDDVYAFTPRPVRGKRRDLFLEFEQKRGAARIAKGKPFVMLVRPSMLGYLKKLAQKTELDGALLIYSMWSGYREHDDVKRFLAEARELGIEERTLHTSGHASKQDIERLTARVSASEYVTVHTAKPDCLSVLRGIVAREIAEKLPASAEAESRAEEELAEIEHNGLADYFLTVYDVVQYAKRNNIFIGTGRGSIVGSLVSYALGITAVDPIRHALSANRFWKNVRKEIAIDVDPERRKEICDHLYRRYGEDNVVPVGPAGFQIKKDGHLLPVLHILGWNLLAQIRNTIELIEYQRGDFVEFAYDDARVFDMIANGDTNGVFGLDFAGEKEFLRAFHPNSLEELVEAVTLWHLRSIDHEEFRTFLHGRNFDTMQKKDLLGLYDEIVKSEHSSLLCRSHNFSYYGYMTYQAAYLKCYFPDEFNRSLPTS